MSLRIRLLVSSDKIYSAGERIQGLIELDLKSASQKDDVDKVNLTFSCISKIAVLKQEHAGAGADSRTTTRHYPSIAVLFWRSLAFMNPTFHPPESRRGEDGGMLKWPFEVEIPQYAEYLEPEVIHGLGSNIFRARNEFPASPGHDISQFHPPLPDSMPKFSTTGRDFGIDLTGEVRYVLHVEVPGASSGIRSLFSGRKETEIDVLVLNRSLDVNASQIQYLYLAYAQNIRTLRLLPTHAEARLSLREKTRSIFKKADLPSMPLRMTFRAPDILFLDRPADQPLPLRFNLRRQDPPGAAGENGTPGEDDLPMPRALLKKMSVSLVAHTSIRTSDVNEFRGRQAEGYSKASIFSYKPASKELIQIPIGTDQWFDVAKLGVNWGHLQEIYQVPRYGLVADFATPNMVRRYGLEWDIKINVAGEEMRWETSMEHGGGLPVKIVNGAGSGGDVQPGYDASADQTIAGDDIPGPAAWELKEGLHDVAPPSYDEKPGVADLDQGHLDLKR